MHVCYSLYNFLKELFEKQTKVTNSAREAKIVRLVVSKLKHRTTFSSHVWWGAFFDYMKAWEVNLGISAIACYQLGFLSVAVIK